MSDQEEAAPALKKATPTKVPNVRNPILGLIVAPKDATLTDQRDFYLRRASYFTTFSWIVSILFFVGALVLADVLSPETEQDPTALTIKANEDLNQSFRLAIIGLLMGFAGDRVASMFAQRAHEFDIRITQSDFEAAILKASNVREVGSGPEVLKALAASISQANCVKNTFLNVGSARSTERTDEPEITALYVDFLSTEHARTWYDIISANELFSFRHKHLFADKLGEPSEDAPPGERHNIAVLRSSVPIINFVVIDYPARRPSEVYFGWLYDGSHSTTPIYRSVDPHVVRLFDEYFWALRAEKSAEQWWVNYKRPVVERGPKERFVVDKVGQWVTVAYERGVPIKEISRAALEIDFRDRSPEVHGSLIDTPKKTTRRFSHTNLIESPNKLLFEYVTVQGRRGVCVYEFVRRAGVDTIEGYLLETESDDSSKATRHDIIGVRYKPKHAKKRDVYSEAKQMIIDMGNAPKLPS